MKFETNKKRNFQLGVVIALIGVVFICFLQRREALDIPQKAALTFGYILLFSGALLLLVNEQFEISLDQENSKITYFHKWFLGKKQDVFRFQRCKRCVLTVSENPPKVTPISFYF